MKNIFQHLISVSTICFLILISCSDEKSSFEGGDCYFTSFSLTVDGVVYPAKLADNRINLEIPYGLDISTATVNYKLNEQSTVLPDPSSIQDWSSDQVFRVQSYNNSFNTFVYSVSMTNVANSEDIVLITQADVDAFADKKTNHIKGNLIIGETSKSVADEDVITNLESLLDLVQVDYNIVIRNSFAGDNTDGLSSLKKVGALYIGSRNVTTPLAANLSINLPQIESIGNLIVNSDNVTELSTPKIKEVADIYIKSASLSKLNLTGLESCHGDLTITGANSSLNELLLPNLTSVLGDLSLNNLKILSVVGVNSLQEVGGSCKMTTLDNLEFISLPSLNSVGSDFVVTGNTKLTKIIASTLETAKSVNIANGSAYSLHLKDLILPKLKKVDNGISILYIACEKLDFSSLESVGQSFVIQTAGSLKDLNTPLLEDCEALRFTAVSQLKSFNIQKINNIKKVEFYNCSSLEKAYLPKVIEGDVTISSSASGDVFLDLGELETVKGALTISGFNKTNLELNKVKEVGKLSLSSWNSTLKSISFPALEKAGDFVISNQGQATNLSLPTLSQAKSFSIQGCPFLVDFHLPLFTKVEGQLQLQGSRWGDSYELTNLNAFSALTSAGNINIQYAPSLKDFAGLKNVVKGMDANNWKVLECGYNPTLQDMIDGKYTE